MKIFETVFLFTGVIGAIGWTIVSSKDGFKESNAMIVARSISIAATIDGDVQNEPIAVGTTLHINDLLVKLRNARVDQSRLTELKSRLQYLSTEVTNTMREQTGLRKMLDSLRKRSASYSVWLLNDLRLKKEVTMRQHTVAQKQKKLRTQEVTQIQILVNKSQVSPVTLQAAQTKAEIATNQVHVSKAELTRNELLLESAQHDGIFFEGGDTSYWSKSIDSLNLRVFDNENKIARLRAQIVQFGAQEKVERQRLQTDFVEEHRSPFAGVVNAVYVAKGAHVKSGTTLMQVLDCSNPVVIVPIPEFRFSDFSVGQKVTINPIDSEQSLAGTIKYISSGALIGDDKTIAVQQDMTSSGNRAVIAFDRDQIVIDQTKSCDIARRAIVTIHTKSLYDSIDKWVRPYLTDSGFNLAALGL